MLRERWRLRAGDIFCVGLTQVRVACMSVPTPTRKKKAASGASTPQGVYRILNDDGRLYRRRENKEEKRAAKLKLSEDEDDEASGEGSSTERSGGGKGKAAAEEGTADDIEGGKASGGMGGGSAEGQGSASSGAVATCVDEVVEDDEDSDEEEEDDSALQDYLLGWDAADHGGGDGANGSGSESVDDRESADAPLLRLELVAGPMRGAWLDLDGSGGTIGNSANCTLSLPHDLTVAPLHAAITHVDGAWYLSDVGSRDGTFLLLADRGAAVDIGDRLRVGRTELTLYVRPTRATGDDLACNEACVLGCLDCCVEACSCSCTDLGQSVRTARLRSQTTYTRLLAAPRRPSMPRPHVHVHHRACLISCGRVKTTCGRARAPATCSSTRSSSRASHVAGPRAAQSSSPCARACSVLRC